jgi:hypothetical protein
MGIHLVHVSFAALEAAKPISSSLGVYRTRSAALVASGCLLGFFLERKNECLLFAAGIDKLNW